MTEYEVLDEIFEAMPDDGVTGVSLYEQRGNMTRPELYIRINGECWQITATRHTHMEG